MKIKVKKSAIWLFLILFIADHCLYIFNSNIQRLANEFLWILCTICFSLLFINKFKNIFSTKNYFYGKLIIFIFVIAFFSILQAIRLHGQTFLQGLLPQRFVLGGFLFYFILMHLIDSRKSFLTTLEKTFCFLGYSELFLYILQYVLINKIVFLNTVISTRFGEFRLNLGAIAIPYIIFKSVNNIYVNKKIQLNDLILLILGMYYTIVVSKTRIALVAYIIAFILGFLLMRFNLKKIVVSMILVFSLIGITQTNLYSYVIDGLAGKDLSSQTRELGRAYYTNKFLEHPILGVGYINTNNQKSVQYAGINSIETGIIAWVDLGVYGIAFFFGIVGIIWFLLLYGKMAVQSYQIGKAGNLIYWMYMIYLIVLSPNGTSFMWYISNTIAFVVMLCLQEGTFKRLSSSTKGNI